MYRSVKSSAMSAAPATPAVRSYKFIPVDHRRTPFPSQRRHGAKHPPFSSAFGDIAQGPAPGKLFGPTIPDAVPE